MSGGGGGPEILVGGQAVMEGVMMKMPRAFAVTVRRPSGELACLSGDVAPWSERWPVLKLPLLRGVAVLGQMMGLGFRSLFFSSDVLARDAKAAGDTPSITKTTLTLGSLLVLSAVADGPQGDELGAVGATGRSPAETPPADGSGMSTKELTIAIVMAVVMFILVFKALPLGIAWLGGRLWHPLQAPLAESLISGLALAGVFVGYLFVMSRLPDVRRLFQYHGAEHKVVHLHESGQPLTVENARPFPTQHPRCGTSFMFFVVLTSIVVWSLFPLHIESEHLSDVVGPARIQRGLGLGSEQSKRLVG